MFPKYFTLKEANQLLPLIKPIVADILKKGKEAAKTLSEYDTPHGAKMAKRMFDDVEGLTAKLEAMGYFYKDWNFEIGLVDFPSIIEGEEVFLCWRSDEGEILWYHSMEGGFAGRRPLPAEWLLGDLFKS